MQGYARKNRLCRDRSDAQLVNSRTTDAVDMLGSHMVVIGQLLGAKGLVSEHDIVLIAEDIALTMSEMSILDETEDLMFMFVRCGIFGLQVIIYQVIQ